MGWGYCGTDSQGREIGYTILAICDHPGCEKEIDRGLAYACGGIHGEDTCSCEEYFCEEHLNLVDIDDECLSICDECLKALEEDEGYVYDEEEDVFKYILGGMI